MSKLSVIVPVFNESRQLPAFFERLRQAPCPIERELIFVDDGSQDETHRILQAHCHAPFCRLVRLATNQGKGTAVRRALQEVSGEFVMIQDADFEYDPRDVPALLQPLLDDQADVVYGSRFRQNTTQVHRTYHYFVNRFLTQLSNLLSGIYLTDMETCYKIFRTDLIKSMKLTSRRFGIEVELTACLAKTSARIHELPISYHPRSRLQGKKIGWRDGPAALCHLIHYNLLRSRKQCFQSLPAKYHPLE